MDRVFSGSEIDQQPEVDEQHVGRAEVARATHSPPHVESLLSGDQRILWVLKQPSDLGQVLKIVRYLGRGQPILSLTCPLRWLRLFAANMLDGFVEGCAVNRECF